MRLYHKGLYWDLSYITLIEVVQWTVIRFADTKIWEKRMVKNDF